jgi:hypothetical protein
LIAGLGTEPEQISPRSLGLGGRGRSALLRPQLDANRDFTSSNEAFVNEAFANEPVAPMHPLLGRDIIFKYFDLQMTGSDFELIPI